MKKSFFSGLLLVLMIYSLICPVFSDAEAFTSTQVEIGDFDDVFRFNATYVIYPADSIPKPLNCLAAWVSDWEAAGFVTAQLSDYTEGFDTNGAFVNSLTGKAVGDLCRGILTFGGPLVNPVVKHAESVGTPDAERAPIQCCVEDELFRFQLMNGTEIAGAELPLSVINFHEDMFVIEVYATGHGRPMMLCYGFGWQGTYAAGLYFDHVVYPDLASYTESWLVVRWEDSNGDGIVNSPGDGDTYTLVASGADNVPRVGYRVHGFDFGPYVEEGQDPNYGAVIGEEQIRDLLTTIAPYTRWVRTYGTTNGLEHVGRIAHEVGLQVAAGAWLSSDSSANEEQLTNLIAMGQAAEADLLIVGCETLLRGDLSAQQVIGYIDRVKDAVPGVPVATSDVYSELLAHPDVMAAGDVILMNVYPYWEGISVDDAVYTIHCRYQEVVAAGGGKSVLVAETGWPSAGLKIGDAVPSPENTAFFFLSFVSWARAEDVEYFYFEAFSEPWKAAYEGSQGAHWGVWDRHGNLKPGMGHVFNNETLPPTWDDGLVGGPGDPEIEFTAVPAYGNSSNLKGQVWHVRATEYRVVVYIKVEGGWWTKPYWSNPRTLILPDGSWECDIVTGGLDQVATEIVAYLIPVGYDPPLMGGGSTLPEALDENAVAQTSVTRTP